MKILQTTDLKKYYGTEPNITRALDGVFLFVGVGGHDGGGGIGAALLVRSQLCGGGRDAPGKGVDDHGLTDDAGGGGQNVLCINVQCLAYQCTALLCQRHAA